MRSRDLMLPDLGDIIENGNRIRDVLLLFFKMDFDNWVYWIIIVILFIFEAENNILGFVCSYVKEFVCSLRLIMVLIIHTCMKNY